ncbi:MAG: DUF1588 domain-containing protein [Saprospiraceae bacterium]|nr:DUF1588 domain-containing protein [Saprospiraceae bacterium]
MLNARPFLIACLLLLPQLMFADTQADLDFRRQVRVHIRNHCSSCHNTIDNKGGINLDVYDFAYNVARRGELFRRVIKSLEEGSMPPSSRPPMSDAERDTMIAGINRILDKALAVKDPGPAIMRRLSHREYGYTMHDLLNVQFDATRFFPADASGGEGFDNQSRVLYMTPLLWERYYDAADSLMREVSQSPEKRSSLVTKEYRPSAFRKITNWWKAKRDRPIVIWRQPMEHAQAAIMPFAQRAYRRFLDADEEADLLHFFSTIYLQNWKKHNGFEESLMVVFKKILISPSFLFRIENNLPTENPYPVNNFELASRLSYLLWSSMPDDTLLEVAYREDLHDSLVLRREAERMMRSPKFSRFAANFAPQWLGIQDLTLVNHADPVLFPEFTPSLRQALHEEVVQYFAYVFNQGNLLQLLQSDFSMLNEELAHHYQVADVQGNHLRPVRFDDDRRGGILGMGAVLAATSLPTRTSPVLRGQWVLEKLLGKRVPPPPPDVPDLAEAKAQVHDELDLRSLLEFHREPSACQSCHQKMDPIGFGLENFDAIGRWREEYSENVEIDASGRLSDQVSFEGPGQLKRILVEDQEAFAENFARKMLSFALGRSLQFLDTRTIDQLTDRLISSNFSGQEMLLGLVQSYPFRHRRSDLVDRYKDNKL